MGVPVVLVEASLADDAIAVEVARIHEKAAVSAYAHIFDSPFPRQEAEQRWRTFPGRVVLARRDGEVVGFVAWHHEELCALYVVPHEAGSGTGSALLGAAAGTTRLWVLQDNVHAKAFYEARGWRPSGRTRSVYEGAGETEYVRP